MENSKKKTPWYRISGVISDETDVSKKGQGSALLHFIAVGGITYVLLFIALVLFSAFVYDIYTYGNIVIAIIAFFVGVKSYQKTIDGSRK
jgi:hypothetical protein